MLKLKKNLMKDRETNSCWKHSFRISRPIRSFVEWNLHFDGSNPTNRQRARSHEEFRQSGRAFSIYVGLWEKLLDRKFFRTIIPFEIQKWQELVLPLRYLNLIFEEMALLKALTIYQICKSHHDYKLKWIWEFVKYRRLNSRLQNCICT